MHNFPQKIKKGFGMRLFRTLFVYKLRRSLRPPLFLFLINSWQAKRHFQFNDIAIHGRIGRGGMFKLAFLLSVDVARDTVICQEKLEKQR
ncbi:hypothetical protein ABE26_03740 [Cytobacillus firmus]|nr:hypothetical protein [Cytobacillus firmus]